MTCGFRICVVAVCIAAGQGLGQQAETRSQAVLRTSGKFLPGAGGYEVTGVDADGPCARMKHPTNPNVRGILDVGDVVTKVDGKTFRDRRDLLDLLNAGHQKNSAVVLSVKDVNTGTSQDWVVRPEVVVMEVPPKSGAATDDEFGATLPKLKDLPKLPPAFFPTEEP